MSKSSMQDHSRFLIPLTTLRGTKTPMPYTAQTSAVAYVVQRCSLNVAGQCMKEALFQGSWSQVTTSGC